MSIDDIQSFKREVILALFADNALMQQLVLKGGNLLDVVYAYSPGMLVAEKLRAICQQMPEYTNVLKKHRSPRGRDFLDIHTVAEYFKVDFGSSGFQQTVKKVFQAKQCTILSVGMRAAKSAGIASSRADKDFWKKGHAHCTEEISPFLRSFTHDPSQRPG